MDRLEGVPQTRLGYIEQFVDSMLTILYYHYRMDVSRISDVTWKIMEKVAKEADEDLMLEPPIDQSPRLAGILVAENMPPYDSLPMNEKKIELMVMSCVVNLLDSLEEADELDDSVDVSYWYEDEDDDNA